MIKLKQLSHQHHNEEVIKKSTFIAIVAPVTSVEQAHLFIKDHSNLNATHNCWAYRIKDSYRFNDDGEPSGTAGKPILNAIDGQEFDNTVALVIRHYGGIKLGTGGLMRAYGGSVNRCLQNADFEIIQDFSRLYFSAPFPLIQSVHNLSKNYQARILKEQYFEQGAHFEIELLSASKDNFKVDANNMSKGQLLWLNKDGRSAT